MDEGLSVKDDASIAHVRASDGAEQPLYEHLTGTAEISKRLATKIGLPLSGELIGLVHDLGKFSQAFQTYIRECVKFDNYKKLGLNLDEDEEAEPLPNGKPKRGSVDHSTAGAIYLLKQFQTLSSTITIKSSQKKVNVEQGQLLADILFICVASHHSGTVNVVDKEHNHYLDKRKKKDEKDSHYQESLNNATTNHLFTHLDKNINNATISEFSKAIKKIIDDNTNKVSIAENKPYKVKPYKDKQIDFYIGFYARLLFSCLIDADRSNSIAFEYPQQAHLLDYQRPNWGIAINKVEAIYQDFADKAKNSPPNPINEQRNLIAQTCYEAGQQAQGIYTLTVPTGGGKTLASLRFAVQHAKRHNLDRIIYIIPFTSIIEQNAQEVRKILEEQHPDGSYANDWVLEQHSNLEPDVQTWQSKLIMDNWNAPIVFTTMVQFLESCFGGGTKGVRRLHQLSRAVLIFDEIQTLPINCYYLFCNAINFLTRYVNTTAVLCTATQPILDKLPQSHKGSLNLHKNYELIGSNEDLHELFNTLERVEIHDKTANQGSSLDDIVKLAWQQFEKSKSTLIIVNTKQWAKDIYLAMQLLNDDDNANIYHLSTAQCAKHRKTLITEIRNRLKNSKPTIVISTQLIEAGVDISFATVIRFLAGLDSIAQAAGRCNRHGEMQDKEGNRRKGQVFIINPDKEPLGSLPTIAIGKQRTQLILNQLKDNPTAKSLLHPDHIKQYFTYFTQHENIQRFMSYPVDNTGTPSSDGKSSYSILNWLSDNDNNPTALNRNRDTNSLSPLLSQSFMEAGRAFKAINAPTYSIIVPYEEGKGLITSLLNKEYIDEGFYKLVKQAQQYSINIFSTEWEKIVHARQQVLDTGIYVLPLDSYYDKEFGLNVSGDSYAECDIL